MLKYVMQFYFERGSVMAKAVVMPKAGISVESCIIGQWFKKVGDTVAENEILFDYETDKATFECESTAAGTLLEIFFESGDEVPCLVNVCAIGEAGEDASGLRPSDNDDIQQSNEIEVKPTLNIQADTSTAAPTGESKNAPVSPRAKKLAKQLKVDISEAIPTGPRGRVIAKDIEIAAQRSKVGTGIGGRAFGEAQTGLKPGSTQDQSLALEYTEEKFSQIRKVISSTMIRSLSELAQLTHHHSFDAEAILSLREKFKNSDEMYGLKGVTINDIILFAASRTLRAHPSLNAHLINGDTLRKFNGVNIGVAIDTPRGLIVPTLRGADKKSLKEISLEVKRLAELAQSGNIGPDLMQGATFTVSNLGSLGVEMFTPIINPPQVAILGVCGISTKIRSIAGEAKTYQGMGLSLTYDHRAIDGAPASRFAHDLCKNLENILFLLAADGVEGS